MQPLRYSINVSLDGCCDHREGIPDEELHRRAAATLARADALIFGRITYEMMESAWRLPIPRGTMPEWTAPFAETIDAAKKYVVSTTLTTLDWNSELLRGDLADAVTRLKQQPGRGLYVGGVTLPLALAELGLIDEYEFVVYPRVIGHGPTLFSGLSRPLDLELTGREELGSGAVALTYRPR
ncbi:dihydrofolate reductase family protein [Gordonia sp. VNK1]|uniref:dihydrofolate reductase family protein n=1 Tax=Gordonia oleivorans TaxID=3156618 RepID=UPI0032B3E057